MNILFITHYQQLYGANKSLSSLLKALDPKKYNSMVICPWTGALTDHLNKHNIQNISGYYYSTWSYSKKKELLKTPYRMIRSWWTLATIYKQVKQFKPDIIYSNSSVVWIGKAIATLLNKPHIWHIREFGDKDYGLKLLGGRVLFNQLLNTSAAVIAISKAIDKEVLPKVHPQIKHQIYNGIVAAEEIIISPKELSPDKDFTFCMAGLLHPGKGLEEAIKAIAVLKKKHPRVKLLVLGKGMPGDDYEEYLQELSHKLGLDHHINFLGYVEDITSIYLRSHCLLMCSESEGLGRVTIEAMAKGLPVIGRNSGGTPEIVTHGYNGFLYKQGYKELAACMFNMINSPIYHLLCENANQTVRERFTIENYTAQIERLLYNVHMEKGS